MTSITKAIEALKFYAEQDNWDKGVVRPPNGQYQKWMMASCDKGNRAREALATLPDKPMTEDQILLIMTKAQLDDPEHETISILKALKAANVLYVEEK